MDAQQEQALRDVGWPDRRTNLALGVAAVILLVIAAFVFGFTAAGTPQALKAIPTSSAVSPSASATPRIADTHAFAACDNFRQANIALRSGSGDDAYVREIRITVRLASSSPDVRLQIAAEDFAATLMRGVGSFDDTLRAMSEACSGYLR